MNSGKGHGARHGVDPIRLHCSGGRSFPMGWWCALDDITWPVYFIGGPCAWTLQAWGCPFSLRPYLQIKEPVIYHRPPLGIKRTRKLLLKLLSNISKDDHPLLLPPPPTCAPHPALVCPCPAHWVDGEGWMMKEGAVWLWCIRGCAEGQV